MDQFPQPMLQILCLLFDLNSFPMLLDATQLLFSQLELVEHSYCACQRRAEGNLVLTSAATRHQPRCAALMRPATHARMCCMRVHELQGARYVGTGIAKGAANPTATLLSTVFMLHHLRLASFATRLEDAVLKVCLQINRYVSVECGKYLLHQPLAEVRARKFSSRSLCQYKRFHRVAPFGMRPSSLLYFLHELRARVSAQHGAQALPACIVHD
jgi:hypothetical protein